MNSSAKSVFQVYFFSSVALFSSLISKALHGNSSQRSAAGLTPMVVCEVNRYVSKLQVSDLQLLPSV